ncbi:NAD(P)-dependent oxidoreductase [Bittarella sp. HCP28S3_D9]|uniref:NAD(P)-dependent oxidoreductase n=1 Tax=Bittarella sp. HCP28S3_D9 TaxID=3440253 RepID=UPI003F88850F
MKDKTVVLNADRINYDGKIDFSHIASQVTVYGATDEGQLLERIQGYDIVVTKEMSVSAESIRRFPDSVKLLCEAGTGYNNIDLAAAKARGITVCNIPAYSTQRVAHTVFLLLLNLFSSMQKQQAMLCRGDHSNFEQFLQVDHLELNGKTLGVVGAGHIGRAVIRLAHAFDMEVLAYTRTPRPDEEGVRYVPLDTLLRESDAVTLHCPLTDQTRHLIDEAALAKMKPTAFLINTSRGALIDEPALIRALAARQIAGAGLDVLEQEPPRPDNPLYTLDNVVLTPHMGWKGLETRQRLVDLLGENIAAFCRGEPRNVIV